MDIIQGFGINWVLLGAQIVNFLILLYILKRFAYKPILKLLKERQAKIAESIDNAKASEEALEKALEKEKEILKKAQKQAQEILAEAKKQSESVSSTTQEEAKKHADRILEDAKKEIQRESQETQKRLEAHTTKLAISILEKSLKDLLDEKDQEKVIEKALRKISSK